MNVVVGPDGRIELPVSLLDAWGVQPGDHLVIEQEQGRWVIKPSPSPPLRWEGNILVFDGELPESFPDVLEAVREEQLDRIEGEG